MESKYQISTAHYHFGCFQHLSDSELEQLVAIINASGSMDNEDKKDIIGEIKLYLKERSIMLER